MADKQQAIVIGGGVIGCATAYYLAKRGWAVRLLEAGQVGRGCSHGNCGFVCPSHVLPLTTPGAPWRVMRQMFSPDSPVYVKPRLDPALWAWFARFAANCRQAKAMQVSRARHALLASSMELYRQLLADEPLDVEWHDEGLLLVYKSPRDFEAHEKTASIVRKEFGIEATRLSDTELAKFEPALRPGLAGGWHYPGDSHLRPDRLLSALASLLRQLGVQVHEQAPVTRIVIENGRATAVETATSSFDAEVVVVAAGARAPNFAHQLGCQIPIQPGKGYSVTMARPASPPRVPLLLEEYHVAITPWESGLRVGSTMEFVGYDASINRRRLRLFERAVEEHLTKPLSGPVEEEWSGWRPMTCDELPCIGPAPRAANVIVAAGHGMIGVATATASGKLAAELASGITPHVDPAPYAPGRFG